MSWMNVFGTINFIFLFFVGLPLIIIGALLGQIAKNSFEDTSFKITQDVNREIGVNIDVLNNNFNDVSDPLKIIFVSLGCTITFVCLLGVIGTCCEFKPVFLLYLMVMLMGIFFQLIVIIRFMIDTNAFLTDNNGNNQLKALDGCLKPRLRATIEDSYEGVNSSETITVTWNTIMIDYQCCGVDSYVDFNKAKQWKRELNGTTGFQAPLVCCHKITTDYECALKPRIYSSYFQKGCYAKFKEKIIAFKEVIIVIAIVILGFQIAMVCLDVYVMQMLNTNEWFRQGVLKLFCLGDVNQDVNKPV